MRAIALLDLSAQRHRLGSAVEDAILRVVERGDFILGREVVDLEEALRARTGAADCITCGSGTEALLLSLMAWEVGPGDGVIVPAFTFPATAEVPALLGATPVFADVRADTFNLDADGLDDAVAAAEASGIVPRVVIAVDLFGQPADYDGIEAVARRHNLKILTDAAQSLGAGYRDSPVGTLGDATAVSFFPSKPLGCYGDGGAVLTDDPDMARLVRSIRSHGRGATKYEIVRLGVNSRLDTVQAAVLLAKLTIFDEELRRRQEIAERYTAALAGTAEVPALMSGCSSAWAQFTVKLDERDRVAAQMAEHGVPTAVYYPASLNTLSAYRHLPSAKELSTAQDLPDRVLSIPMHPYLSNEDVDRVIDSLISAAVGEG